MELLLQINWISLLLIFFTLFLVVNDRSFAKKVRTDFIIALVFCLFLSLLSKHLSMNVVQPDGPTERIVFGFEAAVRPIVLYMLIRATSVWSDRIISIIWIPLIANVLFAFLRFKTANVFIFSVFVVLLFATLLKTVKDEDKTEYVFCVAILIPILASACSELFLKDYDLLNTSLSITVCVYYYNLVMAIYKRDGLTGLLMRHNLNYEMVDLGDTVYDLVLIDVDNFKLINDKYGHDKGDEVLVTIVNTVKQFLPKGCRMYRYGGDEFVIISNKVDLSVLEAALDRANNKLSAADYHMSYGIVKHNPGDDNLEVISIADSRMYENKRLLKSEDIWDDMTGLYNYRGFLDEMELFRKAVKSEGHHVCLIGVDIDRLNSINMAFGYTEGNYVIKTLARVMKNCLSGRDFLGHLGSDEFVMAVECTGSEDDKLEQVIATLKDSMDAAYELTDKDYYIKLNVAKYYVDDGIEIENDDLVNNVLYIKQEEKDNRRKNDANDEEQDYNDQEEKIVLDILDNNKFKYAFQPIVSAKDGNIVAYEALMRSDTETMVSPIKILKYAERNKRSYEIEKYTFFNVLSQLKTKEFPETASIFINSIPGYLLSDEDYDLLKSQYSDYFERMVIEITEQREVDDNALVAINTRRSRDGFNLAIDDYGSGCSNTNSLLRYMPQIVKLDRLLITGIDRNAKKQFFVNSIISFARENDMFILAEGVETERELKTVIRLGVDFVQGYITARPSLELIKTIPDEIKKIIVDENLKVGSNQRMIYTASGSCELSVVHLAMEDYSKINISGEYVTLTGNEEYTADMVLRIKEGVNCHLTLRDVRLNSVDDEPCIDIGDGTNLTLNLEGNNSINFRGIHVPESSSLTVIGAGNLAIHVKGHECYGIGSDTESDFGKLVFNGSGIIDLIVDGENCIGIGGGIPGSNSSLVMNSGNFNINVAGVYAIGIGCFKGSIPIRIKDTNIKSDFRVNKGIVLGILEGTQDIEISNFTLEISGSGSEIAGVGTICETSGTITMTSGNYINNMSGHIVYLLGCPKGGLAINISHARIDMLGEGDIVTGFGDRDKNTTLAIKECSLKFAINASSPVGFGTRTNDIIYIGSDSSVRINGDDIDYNNLDAI